MMKHLMVAVCVCLLIDPAFVGAVAFNDAETSIHNKVSIAAATTRIDTVVFVPLMSGSTTTRRGPSQIAITWSSKMTNTSGDSVPTFTLKTIIGGNPSNIELMPGILDSLWGKPPAQTATWRTITWFYHVINDSHQVIVRNRTVTLACSSSVCYRILAE